MSRAACVQGAHMSSASYSAVAARKGLCSLGRVTSCTSRGVCIGPTLGQRPTQNAAHARPHKPCCAQHTVGRPSAGLQQPGTTQCTRCQRPRRTIFDTHSWHEPGTSHVPLTVLGNQHTPTKLKGSVLALTHACNGCPQPLQPGQSPWHPFSSRLSMLPADMTNTCPKRETQTPITQAMRAKAHTQLHMQAS